MSKSEKVFVESRTNTLKRLLQFSQSKSHHRIDHTDGMNIDQFNGEIMRHVHACSCENQAVRCVVSQFTHAQRSLAAQTPTGPANGNLNGALTELPTNGAFRFNGIEQQQRDRSDRLTHTNVSLLQNTPPTPKQTQQINVN